MPGYTTNSEVVPPSSHLLFYNQDEGGGQPLNSFLVEKITKYVVIFNSYKLNSAISEFASLPIFSNELISFGI